MTDDGAITRQERGDTHSGLRGVARVFVVIAVVVLVVGVVLAGNFVHTGTFLPWLASPGRSDTAVAKPAPTSTATDAAGRAAAPPQTPAEHVAAEDARLSAVAALGSGDPALVSAWNTVVVGLRNGQSTSYSLGDLVALGAVRQDDDATFTLVRNVVVRAGAALDLVAPGATLRMTSSPSGATSIVGWGGNVQLAGAEGNPLRVTSWDESIGAPDDDESDGRAYVRVRDAALSATFADFSDLGYWSGRTGGLAITGSGTALAGARLQNTAATGLHYGLFASESTGVAVVDSTITGSALTGIELTNGAADTTVQGTTVRDSGGDGISLSRQSKNLSLTDATVETSAGWGIRIDGAALADGPTTGGYGLMPSTGFTMTESRVQGNRDGGVRVISTDKTEITRSTVDETRTAVLVEGPATGVTVANADLSSGELRALDLTGTITDATVSDSRLVGRRIALELNGAVTTVRGNDVTVASGYAVELGEDARADITGNTFHGVGQDAVAVWSGARTMQADNDQSDWMFQWAWVGWMNDHPMMWMWALVLLVPAIGIPFLWRRSREHRRLRELLRQALLRHGEEQMFAYRATPEQALALADAGSVDAAAGAAPASAAPARAVTASDASTSTASANQYSPRVGATGRVAYAAEPRAARPGPARAGAPGRPRSFADLRTGVLEGRTFASLREFAVAAVVEGGYSVSTISRLFRIQQWRLQQWVDEATVVTTPPGRMPYE